MTSTAFPSAPTIRLRSTRDVLAAIPYLLGYRPAECAVVVGVTGEGRLGPVAHVTLADLPVVGAAGVHMVARRAAQTGAKRAVVGIYTRAGDSLDAVRDVVGPLLTALEIALDDVETWHLTDDGYRGLDCTDPACCPPGGHPRAQLETSAVSAAFVVAGSSVAPTAAAAVAIPRAPSAARDLAGRAARRHERATEATTVDGAAGRARADDGCAIWRDAFRHAMTELELSGTDDGWAPPRLSLPPATLGRLAAALADTSVRDAILVSVVAQAGRDRGAHGSAPASGLDIELEAAEACARLIDPASAVAPDTFATSAARAVLEAVVAHVPRRLQAAPLTLLGLVAWWCGQGALAGARVREALATDRDYRLAILLGDILAAAIPPGWVRRSSTEGVG